MYSYQPESLYYDDIKDNIAYITESRTVTEADVMAFAGLTGDYNELHTSADFAQRTSFGRRIAHGMLTLSIANGLYMRMNVFTKNTLANLGIEKWSFTKPVELGDTLHVMLMLESRRVTSDKHKGVVYWRVSVLNQRDEEVANGIWVKLFRTRFIDDAN